MPRFEVVRERSTVRIEARSTLHPIQVDAEDITGFLELTADRRGRPDPALPCRGRLDLPVRGLRSGLAVVDRETERRLDADRYPTIVANLDRLEGPVADGTWHATGRVMVRGRSCAADGRLAVEVASDGVTVTGHRTFDVRDWGLDPPRLLVLRVHPEVSVHVELHAEPA